MLSINLDSTRKVPVIICRIQSTPISTLFDTGAEVCVLDNRLGLSLIKAGILKPSGVTSNVITPGSKYSNPMYIISEFTIGSIVVKNLPVVLIDISYMNVKMILGSFVFRNNMFTISYATNSMIIDDNYKEINVVLEKNKVSGKAYCYVPLSIIGESNL